LQPAVLARLFLLFILVPLADLILLLMIGRIHWSVSVLAVIISGIFGAWFAKRSGITVLGQIRQKLQANQIPTDSLADGAIVLFAAGLLLTPGLITDFFGMTMLIPWTRKWYKQRLLEWLKRRFKITDFANATGFHNQSDVVDSHVVDRESNETSETESTSDESPEKKGPIQGEIVIEPKRLS